MCMHAMFTLEHTLAFTYIISVLFGIIKYCHILLMYSIQDLLGKKKNLNENEPILTVVLRHLALSFVCSLIQLFFNWKLTRI